MSHLNGLVAVLRDKACSDYKEENDKLQKKVQELQRRIDEYEIARLELAFDDNGNEVEEEEKVVLASGVVYVDRHWECFKVDFNRDCHIRLSDLKRYQLVLPRVMGFPSFDTVKIPFDSGHSYKLGIGHVGLQNDCKLQFDLHGCPGAIRLFGLDFNDDDEWEQEVDGFFRQLSDVVANTYPDATISFNGVEIYSNVFTHLLT